MSCSSLTKDREGADLHLKVGTSQLQSGLYPQALTSLLQAQKLDDTHPQVQNNLGLAYFVRERYDLAEKHIRNAILLDPKYSDARNNLARVLIERGQYTEALKEVRPVLNDLTYQNPEKPFFNAGLAYFYLKDFTNASLYFRRSLQVQKENCLAQSFLGRTYYEQKQWYQASENLDRAASYCQKDQFDEPQFFSGLSYMEQGLKEKAEARWDELLKVYPSGKYRSQAQTLLKEIRR